MADHGFLAKYLPKTHFVLSLTLVLTNARMLHLFIKTTVKYTNRQFCYITRESWSGAENRKDRHSVPKKNKTDFPQTLFKRVEQTTILEYKRQKDIKEDLYAQGFEQRSPRKT